MAFIRGIAARTRSLVQHALFATRLQVLLGVLLILSGSLTALGLTLSGAQPVAAGSVASSGICLPDATYAMPADIALVSASNGVVVQDDGVSHYGVGGADATAIRSALNSCAPSFMGSNGSGEFLAYTSYTVNWAFDIQHDSATSCQLSSVKVGLHLSQLLPSLMNESTAGAAVKSKWASFDTGLIAHENGHKAIDIQQADSLYDSLGGLRADCTSIAAQAQSIINVHLQAFKTANADHDTDTDYGVDQGASW